MGKVDVISVNLPKHREVVSKARTVLANAILMFQLPLPPQLSFGLNFSELLSLSFYLNLNSQPPKKRLTLCVEGNISVGKTTFLRTIANKTLELQDLVDIVLKPVKKWQDVGQDRFNILDAFYAEPQSEEKEGRKTHLAKLVKWQRVSNHRYCCLVEAGCGVPDGKHFPESALMSLDFSRAMP
ncbi:P-loop containing nucleoside triphosphate hydrolases superfamily protein [Actinidia rufa]|uniref:P-loop containing nucleoside triphosphate hydrolases superfamily protein n=1 Tax=Actinidia rufa TaxID=165716 RepID=A0A7J0F9B1_9ERIC|nr:P-loop containing nucleoside triphosphate hydrolases superfamily protein [Actinidia rufa]